VFRKSWIFAILALTFLLTGLQLRCSASGSTPATPSVLVYPGDITLAAGASEAFLPQVAGVQGAVTWAPSAGTITAQGIYTAPATPGTYTVTATVGTTSGQATVMVVAPPDTLIALNPPSVNLFPNGTQAFTYTVTGTPLAGSPAWKVDAGTLGGTVDGSGNYKAPAAPGIYYVRAMPSGTAGPGGYAVVNVRSQPATGVTTLAAAPDPAVVTAGGMQPFAATLNGAASGAVGWAVNEGPAGGSFGTGAAGAVYTAPATPGVYEVLATATADPTQTAIATVNVVAAGTFAVAVDPPAPILGFGAQQTFTARVSVVSNQAVTWSVDELAAGTGITSAGVFTAPASGGPYHVRATSAEDGTTSGLATVTLAPPPLLTTQPLPQTVTAPASATFSVGASGSPDLAYQWYVNGPDIANGPAMAPGASAAATYTTPPTTPANNGETYYCLVTGNGVGIPSNVALLTVDYSPVISAQPGDQSVPPGGALNLSVTAAGNPGPLAYQWYHGGSPIAGATSSTYSVAAAASGDAGTYYVVVTDPIGSTRSATATVTVAAASNLSVAGNVFDMGGNNLEGITVTLGTSPAMTATTTSSGFTFTGVAPGTWTVTATDTSGAGVPVMYPASQTVTLTSANATGVNFHENVGYPFMGHVTYSGSHSGPISVVLYNVATNESFGTLVPSPSPGTFLINGVPAGAYILVGSMDTSGMGALSSNEPYGIVLSLISVPLEIATDWTLALSDQAVSLPAAPPGLVVSPMHDGAAVAYTSVLDASHEEEALTYTLDWSASAGFSPLAGSRTFPINHQDILINTDASLVDGSSFYFRLRGNAGGLSTSYAATASAVTIGAGPGGNSVSGSVTFPGTATGPLHVGLLDPASRRIFAATVAGPASPQAYTIPGVPDGAYQLFALLDQNGDGLAGPGDLSNLPNAPALVVSGSLTGQDLVLSAAGSTAQVTTTHIRNAGAPDTYALDFQVVDGTRHVAAVHVASGPNAMAPADRASLGSSLSFSNPIATARPAPGDTYSLDVQYSDGTSETLHPQVTAVVDTFPGGLAPAGNGGGSGTGADVQPVFTWTAPAAPLPSYTYLFTLQVPGAFTPLWQVPGPGSIAAGLPASVLSLTWGVDPTRAGNLPAQTSLTVGQAYLWMLSVQDPSGNLAQASAGYTP